MTEQAEQGIPAGRIHIIERPRLTRLLDETSARVIMLVAPAGYGKTTLARQWLADKPHAWYQATTASGDVAALALGLIETASTVLPEIGRRLREWLPTSRNPENEVSIIAKLLGDELASWPPDAWFAIDDYHLLSSEASDELVRRLIVEPGHRLLLASRTRPGWSSARDLLYGTHFRLSEHALAMTADEANSVLLTCDETATGLVALANGWPAVIGLAALTPNRISDREELPDALYEFLAEEIFAALSDETRDRLCELAMLPAFDRGATGALLGNRADHVLEEGRRVGLFAVHESNQLEFHPLLRAFLNRKLKERPSAELQASVASAARFLIDQESWDDAFTLVDTHRRLDLLDELLAPAITPIIKQGRLVTLREWLAFARQCNFTSPYVSLADAELSFRRGAYRRSAILALDAAAELPTTESLKSAAFFRAGQSEYLTDRQAEALEHFGAARELACTPTDARNALWGEFTVLVDLESPACADKLIEFEAIKPRSRSDSVRHAAGELSLAAHTGGLDQALALAHPLVETISDVDDPIVRSSFWHAYAGVLTLTGNYEAALSAVKHAFRETQAFDLDFATPLVLLNHSGASIGLKRFQEAHGLIRRATEGAVAQGNGYIIANAQTYHCRLLVSEGSPRAALEVTAKPLADPLAKSMKAEFLLARAAAYASEGDPEAAIELVTAAKAMSNQLEPQLGICWTSAICALVMSGGNETEGVHAAYETTVASGAVDALVFACRMRPEVLPVLAQDQDKHAALTAVFSRANDFDRLRAAAIDVSQPHNHPASVLTAREREVYALLSDGQTNREIATALFITEATAKVHVRHILKKLGVRTRLLAALQGESLRESEP